MISLRIVGVLYLVSGLWCALNIEVSAHFLGIVLTNAVARSEFLSVYGGLQIGLGVAAILSSFRRDYHEGALYFSAIYSTSLFVFRCMSVFMGSQQSAVIGMCVLEAVLCFILWRAWWRLRSPHGEPSCQPHLNASESAPGTFKSNT